ncbi:MULTISPECIES: inositol monophosphatase family protein [Neptunomonas]|uniref:Inositol monophosphatase n=1 Tax=Neptunomonas marina TaxID=1815562 RepID=A0A437Q6J5_9GAMM|nr:MULTISPECIES: inositol monophosphatase family protein [Neptunomonas]RVU30134.1 inositol monophosphatase [Neptunomonas marina]
MQPMLNIALRAARLAGEQIARAAERLDLMKSEQESVGEFISDAATKAEQTIAFTIQKAYPAHAIHGEYSGQYQPSEGEAEVTWQINPIDSLANFSNGIPAFAICMSAVIKGRIEHALILNPLTGEEYTASRGNGAQLNGKRIRTTNLRALDQAVIGTCFLNTPKEKARFDVYKAIFCHLQTAGAVTHNGGSVALNMAYTAAGRFDGFVQQGANKELLDAGALLIQEAGGLLGDFRGGNTFREHGDTVAANPKLFKALLKSIHQATA